MVSDGGVRDDRGCEASLMKQTEKCNRVSEGENNFFAAGAIMRGPHPKGSESCSCQRGRDPIDQGSSGTPMPCLPDARR